MYDEAADFREHVEEIKRLDQALELAGVKVDWRNARVCDIGGGGGTHAGLLACRACRVHCADLIDQNTRYDGQFVKLLAEKFGRYDLSLPIDRLEFNVSDAMDLIYRDGWFDFACSINSFEHIPDPARALREVARVLRSDAYAYISFDPLWTADTGSHFQHRVAEPWAHLVLSDDEFVARMLMNGADQWEVDDYRGAMNRRRLCDYDKLLRDGVASLGFDLVWHQRWTGVADPVHTSHGNFAVARRSYSEEELLTRGMTSVLRKR
jgi:ubiquinone/menaquinone biosynthesis C-methylase UbiE